MTKVQTVVEDYGTALGIGVQGGDRTAVTVVNTLHL